MKYPYFLNVYEGEDPCLAWWNAKHLTRRSADSMARYLTGNVGMKRIYRIKVRPKK